MTSRTSRAAVRAAVDLLCEAWAPPGPPGRIDMFGDLQPPGSPNVACKCGGNRDRTESGSGLGDIPPVCSHTPQCSCTECVHTDHVRHATCTVDVCDRPTQIQITPWSLQPGGTRWSTTEGDPLADADGTVSVGDRRILHEPLFACGTVHARQLVDADRRRNQDPSGRRTQPVQGAVDQPATRFYDVTSWAYEPDQVDVDYPINQVPGHLDFALGYAQRAMAALFAGDRGLHDRNLRDTQQSLAWALAAVASHQEQLAADAPSTPTD